MDQNTRQQVKLVDVDNLLNDRMTPLSKVQSTQPPLPNIQEEDAKIPWYSEITRRNKSARFTDNGEEFLAQRFVSEIYPIDAPLCTPFFYGEDTRFDGRDQVIRPR